MQVYLVGGAVRDKLLKRPVKERDWVVVGATEQEMLQRGFKKVGRDFPVFLHPQTHEEYALARTERKTGAGYINFVCHASPEVTLEDDLKRRDLTINAMAEDLNGAIIDPFHGQQDLKNGVLRHVSPAFAEDPVRILRIARFAARLGNFNVHPQTNKLMQEMLARGEVDALVPERVWQELARAINEPHPEKFFTVLSECQVLPKLFPAIADNFFAIKIALEHAIKLSTEPRVRLAAIAFNFIPDVAKLFCSRYKIPNIYREVIMLTLRLKEILPNIKNQAENLITLLEITDGYRKLERLHAALLACQSNQSDLTTKIKILIAAQESTKNIRLTALDITQTDKDKLRPLLHTKRVQQLENTTAKP